MFRSNIDKRLVTLTAPASMEAEQYQALRLKLEHLHRERDVRVIGITSPGARDGKTVTAINLAAALAEGSNARVLLIEADLRRPAVSRYLALGDEARPGLAELVQDSTRKIEDAIGRHEQFAFETMIAGSPDTPVHQIFRMPRMQTLLAELRQRYDFVVIDTPPVGPVSDCALLARWMDGLVVIVTAHKTPRKQLENALNTLEGAPVLGIIFNRDDKARAGYRRDYRGYFPRARRRPTQPTASVTTKQ
jgi:capsular exopolysaccharide synthesis family protein